LLGAVQGKFPQSSRLAQATGGVYKNAIASLLMFVNFGFMKVAFGM